jgi:predicted Zn finger-like uncharacterized protein
MIVQCEACQTRFRLADEKVKPGGTKVRCSKCKEVFTVLPLEAEPAVEEVEFDSYNMEKVTDESPGTETHHSENLELSDSEVKEQQKRALSFGSGDQFHDSGIDHSAIGRNRSGDDDVNEETADDFKFSEPNQFSEMDDSPGDVGFSFDDEPKHKTPEEESSNFDDALTGAGESVGPVEFDFSKSPDSEDSPASESQNKGQETYKEFSFDYEETDEHGSDEVARQDASEPDSFEFDAENKGHEPRETSDEENDSGAFSFDDENPFGEDSETEWSDNTATQDTSFDFDEPRFETDSAPEARSAVRSGNSDLQFGEIDFSSANEQHSTEVFQSTEDFSKTTLVMQEEAPLTQRQSTPTPKRDFNDLEPLTTPPSSKKSSLSRILSLLVLLLCVLAGAAGYLYVQEGSLNLNTVLRYLPFLQDYIGEAPVASSRERIGINILGSSYVTGQAGQMLVIQGTVVNNHSSTRSAITIKGILLDSQDKALLQQTVFCGNKLDEAALKTMPFAAIEEAMNNQFGDSLSNMNVAAGATIPFTIVFRNLPAGIAKINVEVVDSKPGAG